MEIQGLQIQALRRMLVKQVVKIDVLNRSYHSTQEPRQQTLKSQSVRINTRSGQSIVSSINDDNFSQFTPMSGKSQGLSLVRLVL